MFSFITNVLILVSLRNMEEPIPELILYLYPSFFLRATKDMSVPGQSHLMFKDAWQVKTMWCYHSWYELTSQSQFQRTATYLAQNMS